MEVPTFGKPPTEKRRKTERRSDGRESQPRRSGHDRRTDHLGRFVVSVLQRAGLSVLARQVVMLARRGLLGPTILLGSLVVYVLLYAREKGIIFAFLLSSTLVIHEMGHMFPTKWCGFRVHWPYFMPYIGALMRLANITNRGQEAMIACGGPLLGGMVTGLMYYALRVAPISEEGVVLLHQFVVVGAFLNWFNLIPIPPLDGGRMTQASHWVFQVFGFAFLLLLSWVLRQPIFLIIWMVVVIDRFLEYSVWRFVGALLLLIAFAALLYLGVGAESMTMTENAAYLLFATFLVIMCRPTELPHPSRWFERDRGVRGPLPQLPFLQRVMWGVVWIAMFSLMSWLLWDAVQYRTFTI
jgi:Zn-dependent protease